jgi:hypothetical protein
MLLQHRSICSARSFSLARSGPKIFTARSPRTPMIISDTRISIGWVKLYHARESGSSTFAQAVDQASLSGVRHSSRLEFRKVSVWFSPSGRGRSRRNADPRHDAGDLRDGLHQRLLDLQVELQCLLQADRRQLFDADDVALVHRRHEGLADLGIDTAAAGQQHSSAPADRVLAAQAPGQQRRRTAQQLRGSQGLRGRLPRSRKEASTGITVSDSSSEAASAKTMVSATGTNSLPSSPCRVSSGRNTVTMIRMPEVTGVATSRTAR